MLRKKEKEHKPEEEKNFSSTLRFFFSLILLFFLLTTTPVATGQNSQNNIQALDTLEENIFHYKFSNESQEERISRLEEFIFGTKYTNQSIEDRIGKLTTATKATPQEKKSNEPNNTTITPEPIEVKEDNQKSIVYDQSSNEGIIGVISNIETKIFNKTFNEIPFHQRIENLEEHILSKPEIREVRKKSLIERVSILVKKLGVGTVHQEQSYPTAPNIFPQQQLQHFNYGYPGTTQPSNPYAIPYGNPLQQGGAPGGQFPYELFFNNQDALEDPGY